MVPFINVPVSTILTRKAVRAVHTTFNVGYTNRVRSRFNQAFSSVNSLNNALTHYDEIINFLDPRRITLESLSYVLRRLGL